MSFGKMNSFIDIVQTALIKDADGFVTSSDVVLASVRAYKEERHGTKMWVNRTAFSDASCLFRFRMVPDVEVTDRMAILCAGARYRILSAEDVRGRGMYIECLCERLEASQIGIN